MANSLIVNSQNATASFPDNATRYAPISGRIIAGQTTEANVQSPIRDGGTFSNLFVYAPTNTASVTSVITLRKSAADTAVTVSYTADQTGIKEDNSNSVLFANTDEAAYSVVIPNEVGSNTLDITIIGIQFAPTTSTDCISYFVEQSGVTLNAASSLYYFTPTGLVANTAFAEAQAKYRARASFTISDFYAYASANNRTTNTVFTTRKSGAGGGQTFTYTSGQTGAKEDSSGSDSLVAGDDFCYEIATGTGTETMTLNIISCSCISTANFFPLLVGATAGVTIGTNTTSYAPSSGLLAFNATEANSQIYPRFDFTASELGVYVSANTSTLLACTVTLRDNVGDSALTVSYAATQTGLKNDSVNTATITSGADEIDYEITNSDLVGGPTITWIGILGSTAAAPSTAKISKMMLMGVG